MSNLKELRIENWRLKNEEKCFSTPVKGIYSKFVPDAFLSY